MKINNKGHVSRILKKTVALVMILLFTISFMTSEMNTTAANDVEWSVTIKLIESGGEEDRVIFGEAQDANDGPPYDKYDIPKPPSSPPPSISAWFYDNLSIPYNLLFKDYRKSPDNYKIWNLSVRWNSLDVSSTTITISWDIQNMSSIEYESLKLYKNDESNHVSDLLIDTSYSFLCQAEEIQQFQIIGQKENLNDKTDNIEISSLFLIIALIIIVIIVMLIIYWKIKR